MSLPCMRISFGAFDPKMDGVYRAYTQTPNLLPTPGDEMTIHLFSDGRWVSERVIGEDRYRTRDCILRSNSKAFTQGTAITAELSLKPWVFFLSILCI